MKFYLISILIYYFVIAFMFHWLKVTSSLRSWYLLNLALPAIWDLDLLCGYLFFLYFDSSLLLYEAFYHSIALFLFRFLSLYHLWLAVFKSLLLVPYLHARSTTVLVAILNHQFWHAFCFLFFYSLIRWLFWLQIWVLSWLSFNTWLIVEICIYQGFLSFSWLEEFDRAFLACSLSEG